MKRVLILGIACLGFVFQSMACDIKFAINGDKKEVYKTGDEVVIDVQVRLIHHHCQLEIKDTKFTYEGLKILGATEWKETQPGNYTRQVKIKITDDKAKTAKLMVTRKCDKEGGYGVCSLAKG